jgi:hypothetical protein
LPALAPHQEQPTAANFPAPWRVVYIPSGFAVEDATGKQIGVFYGRAPDSAGHTGIMTMDEARQMAFQQRQVRQWRMATRVIGVLIGLALAAIAGLILKMIFF